MRWSITVAALLAIALLIPAGAQAQGQRQKPEYGGERRHEDGPKSQSTGLHDRFEHRQIAGLGIADAKRIAQP